MTDKDVEIVKQLKNTFKEDLSCDELYSAVSKGKYLVFKVANELFLSHTFLFESAMNLNFTPDVKLR